MPEDRAQAAPGETGDRRPKLLRAAHGPYRRSYLYSGGERVVVSKLNFNYEFLNLALSLSGLSLRRKLKKKFPVQEVHVIHITVRDVALVLFMLWALLFYLFIGNSETFACPSTEPGIE